MNEYFPRFLICLLFFAEFLYPQTPPYYHYTSSDGLASSTVFDIIQARDGFIWFGTLNGLSRFDGKHFTSLTMNDGLNSNVITSIVQAETGELFIGNMDKGINTLSGKKVDNFCTTIAGERFNTTHLTLYGGKIYGYMSTGSIFITDQNTENRSRDKIARTFPFYINRVATFPDKRIAILTSNGLYETSDDLLVEIRIKDLRERNFFCLTPANDGSYYIGAKGKIFHVKNNRLLTHYTVPLFENNDVTQIMTDSKNNIWFSIFGKGFFLIPHDTKEIINIGKKLDLQNTQVDGFLEDTEHNIWITTFGKGVYCLNNLYLQNFTERDGLTNGSVNCILKEKSGKLLIGTITGINILDAGKLEQLKYNSGNLVTGYINNITSSGNYVYVSLTSKKPESKSVLYRGIKFRFSQNQSICQTRKGNYLFGSIGNNITEQKEFIWKKQPSWFYVFGDSTYLNRINLIVEDSRKDLWVGTGLGLCKLSKDPGKQELNNWRKYFFENDPVLNSKINSICEDKKKNIWVAGVKGIAHYNLNYNSLSSYTTIYGYDLSGSTSIVVDNKQRVWIGNMKGLYLYEGNSIRYLTSQTGLSSSEIITLCYDSQLNKLYIGTNNGVSILDVDAFDKYVSPPLDVKILSVKGGNSTYTNFGNLVFEPVQHNVYISFRALSFSSPGSVKYKYSLNGEWEETGNDFLDFTSLSSGKYELKIIAKTPNSNWSKPAYLAFIIKPRFTETVWFNLLIIFLFIVFFLFIIFLRIKSNDKKNREQLDLTERINELKHQALSAMMNPHFIFNSLNSVQYLINYGRNEEANDYIAMMSKLIRKNLDTAGNAFILLYEEINRLKLYLDLEKLRFAERFSYEIITGADVDAESIMIPNMIIQPFVENTLWHGIINSGISGMVTVTFFFEDVEIDSVIARSLIIKVTDNGVGFKEASKHKKEDHISKGIEIIEERLKLLSTKLELTQPIMFEDLSSRGNNSQGTEVIISLPQPLYKIVDD
jgi:ligand-binding sensor domain-containing protein